ncbi:MAG TPA: hypothetical protein PLH13_03105 [Burkholderiaceae bacterium]|nr:hypothetical protein [Burkholderiaceae bacterium]HRH05491.1 hypothetical protein [Burkholderiaceae bacterium]
MNKYNNIANTLNQGCTCQTLDRDQLRQDLERDASLQGMALDISQEQPHLFSDSAVYLSQSSYQRIKSVISAIERVMQLPAFEAAVLQQSPDIAKKSYGPLGVFMGYDFHIDDTHAENPAVQLIEINTNAGGAMLNAALARAHRNCCTPMASAMNSYVDLDQLENTFFAMFMNEWQLQKGNADLRCIAIVDDVPESQYLAPEFELFRQLFASRGIKTIITDPQALTWRDGQLIHHSDVGDTNVDMVYNRITDFDLSEPKHTALHDAYVSGDVVVTPHPRAHALQANKQHLTRLSNGEILKEWGASEADLELLSGCIPTTQNVTPQNADEVWAERKNLFFKPISGFASKAAYRGDKLTKRVWNEILQGSWGSYVAQQLVPAGHRLVNVDGVATNLKFDVRAYTYGGRIQLLAARIYQGQTTNFRTEGGGFSPVVVVPDTVFSGSIRFNTDNKTGLDSFGNACHSSCAISTNPALVNQNL